MERLLRIIALCILSLYTMKPQLAPDLYQPFGYPHPVEHSVGQTFRATSPNLQAIGIRISSPETVGLEALRFHLVELPEEGDFPANLPSISGSTPVTFTLSSSPGLWLICQFPRLERTEGKRFYFHLSASDSSLNVLPHIAANDEYPYGFLVLDGEPVEDQDLGFVTYFWADEQELVDKLVKNFGEDKPGFFNTLYYLLLMAGGLLGGASLVVLFSRVKM